MNDLITYKLKEVVLCQDIKLNELDYASKHGQTYSFSKYALPIPMHYQGYMKEPDKLVNELYDVDRGVKFAEKRSF